MPQTGWEENHRDGWPHEAGSFCDTDCREASTAHSQHPWGPARPPVMAAHTTHVVTEPMSSFARGIPRGVQGDLSGPRKA